MTDKKTHAFNSIRSIITQVEQNILLPEEYKIKIIRSILDGIRTGAGLMVPEGFIQTTKGEKENE